MALAPDLSRFEYHAAADAPAAKSEEPDLLRGFDYYTIWSCFRGLGPGFGPEAHDGVDMEQALSTGLLEASQRDSIAERLRGSLQRLGLERLSIQDVELQVYPDPPGGVKLNSAGDVIATLGVDALRAFDLNLLNESSYKAILERLSTRLHAADCEKLDLKGNHILLSLDVDGRFTPDREGEPALTLCNFEFVRGLYRPIR